MHILVGYASRHGATRGIAERIATTLERDGCRVSLEPLDHAPSIEAFDACVIGSAAYGGRWIPSAMAFVRAHEAQLATRPVWLFSSGPVGADRFDRKGRDQLLASRPREFAELEATIHPRDARVFFGAWDPAQPAIGWFERLFTPVILRMTSLLPTGDFRDWAAIEAWAHEIAAALATAPAVDPTMSDAARHPAPGAVAAATPVPAGVAR